MNLENVKTRTDLASLVSGVGVELGVAAGDYSAEILRNPRVSLLWSIDRWSDHHDEAEMRRAQARLSEFGTRSNILRVTFDRARAWFDDESFDFIYIDGYAHTGQDGGKTIRDWWPKLKPGGIFSGHDYHPQFQPTIDAVDAFVAEHGLKLHLTTEATYPSWLVVKE